MKHKFFPIVYLILLTQFSALAQEPIGTALETPEALDPEAVIIIPVVVHVVSHSSAQQISGEQIRSQIQVLNQDFRKRNADAKYIPAAFRPLAGDARIEFRLATIGPTGLPTDGIARTFTQVPVFGLDDAIKDPEAGGVKAWNRDEYLNIWVGNLSPGILGYASAPGCPPEKDGVVIRHDAFGTTGTVKAPHHKGRTAVHEIGHWLGLRHIWGDADCGDDRVDDTPPQQGPTRGCPSGVVATCSSGAAGNMYMNFMDFTNDECVNMFTLGQVARMRTLFSAGAARHALLFSQKAAGALVDMESPGTPVWQVYPNPATHELWVRQAGLLPVNSGSISTNSSGNPSGNLAGNLSASTLNGLPDKQPGFTSQAVIFNSLGQPVRQVSLHSGLTRIDIRGLNPGVYYITGTNGLKARFVKIR